MGKILDKVLKNVFSKRIQNFKILLSWVKISKWRSLESRRSWADGEIYQMFENHQLALVSPIILSSYFSEIYPSSLKIRSKSWKPPISGGIADHEGISPQIYGPNKRTTRPETNKCHFSHTMWLSVLIGRQGITKDWY